MDGRSPSTASSGPFAHRDFRLHQAARLLCTLADQMLSVAVAWRLYELTGRPLDLGLLGLVQFVPAIGLSLLAGHATDHFDRRKIVTIGNAALAVTAALLVAFASASAHGGAATWPIYAIMFLFAAVRTFLAPAEQALLPDLVPEEHFASAVAWGSSISEAGTIVGPALGGWIYSTAHGPAPVFLVAAASYLVAAALAGAMAARPVRMAGEAVSFETVVAGVVYVWRSELLLGSISLDLFAVLFGGAVALLPVFAHDVLHVGPWGLGLLRSAPAVGAAAMAVFVASRPIRRRAGATMLACVAIYGAATVVFGASRSLWLSLLALAVLGAADMVSVVVRSTLVQLATPPAMRGRVSAVNMVFVGASSELGALESGLTAAWMGAVPSVIFGGIAACLVVTLYALRFAGLRRVDSLDAPLVGSLDTAIERGADGPASTS
jgi:MFS family permease